MFIATDYLFLYFVGSVFLAQGSPRRTVSFSCGNVDSVSPPNPLPF